MKRNILLLGDPALYEVSTPVHPSELEEMKQVAADLHDTLLDFRETYHCGRAIAAPQIGVHKRLIYQYIDAPTVYVNPRMEYVDGETMEVLDDCMSFPGLLVKVRRYRRCRMHYQDLEGREHAVDLEGDLAELLQHEYDHLDGILAVMRAIDTKSYFLKR